MDSLPRKSNAVNRRCRIQAKKERRAVPLLDAPDILSDEKCLSLKIPLADVFISAARRRGRGAGEQNVDRLGNNPFANRCSVLHGL